MFIQLIIMAGCWFGRSRDDVTDIYSADMGQTCLCNKIMNKLLKVKKLITIIRTEKGGSKHEMNAYGVYYN